MLYCRDRGVVPAVVPVSLLVPWGCWLFLVPPDFSLKVIQSIPVATAQIGVGVNSAVT